ncbi:MAG: hypothetical protein ACR2PX_17715 [Endozoicomonas sp.]|uniref:hypothetical protein n=1 Tax=Endozoicomonas sp. TaxID=1892382 RepID=UPI003D9B3A66
MDLKQYCSIYGFEPDENTLKGLQEIERKVLLSKKLMHIVSGVPLFQLFGTPGTKAKTVYDIAVYDWAQFA